MGLLTGTRCALHPQDPAQEPCRACGRPSCSHCLVGGLCPRCAAPGWEAPPSVRADRARLLSIGGVGATVAGLLAITNVLPRALAVLWPVGLISGLVALVMAIAELAAIARDEQPASGRKLALIAVVASVAHAAFLALFFFGVAVLGFLRGFAGAR